MNPQHVVAALEQIGRLKTIPRTGWVRAGVPEAESVADHSYRTVVLALLLGDQLGVDTDRLIRLLVIHDLAESEVGDLTPEDVTPGEKRRLEDAAMQRLCRKLPNGDKVGELWREYSEHRSPEAKLAKELDTLEMGLQAHEYARQHPQVDLSKFREWARARVSHPALIELLETAYDLDERAK